MDSTILKKSVGLGIIIFIIAEILAFIYSLLANKIMTYGMLGISTTRDFFTGSLLFVLYLLEPISFFITGLITVVTKILNHPFPNFNPIILKPLNLLFWILLSFFFTFPTKKKKLVVVVAIGFFLILNGLFWLPTLFITILKKSLMARTSLFQTYFTTLSAIISIMTGIGLLLSKRWAWIISLIFIFIMCLNSLYKAWVFYPLRPHEQIPNLASQTPYYFSILQFIIFLILIFILTRPKVKEQFK